MILGLTGGIASGKSTVSALFAQRGAIVIDSDQLAREVVEPGTIGLQRVVERFGQGVLQADGRLDRAALGSIIFHDETARRDLNQIIHPLVREESNKRTQAVLLERPSAIIIWDIPLLIEENLTRFVEKVIVVYVPAMVQLQRLMERNNLSEAEAQARIAAQLDIEQKKKHADYLIDNSGTLLETERQVEQLWKHLT